MVVRGEGEKHSLNAGASNTNSSLETTAWFAPPCPLFSLVNSSHTQQKGLSFLQGAEVETTGNQRRGGRPGQLLCSWKARGQPFPKWVEKFVWMQGPFCSVFVSQSGGTCVRQCFRTEWEAGKLCSPKVDVVFVLQRGKLRNRKNKMKQKVYEERVPSRG